MPKPPLTEPLPIPTRRIGFAKQKEGLVCIQWRCPALRRWDVTWLPFPSCGERLQKGGVKCGVSHDFSCAVDRKKRLLGLRKGFRWLHTGIRMTPLEEELHKQCSHLR